MSQSKNKEKSINTVTAFSKAIAKYKNAGIKVGVFENRETDGLTTAQKLAILEFGATISQKASSKTRSFTQRKNKTTSSMSTKGNASQNVSDETIIIPAHAPFRKALVKKKKDWAHQFTKSLAKAIQSNKLDMPTILTDLGETIAKDIRASIEESVTSNGETSTIEQKTQVSYAAYAFLAGIKAGKTKDAITAVFVKDMRGK